MPSFQAMEDYEISNTDVDGFIAIGTHQMFVETDPFHFDVNAIKTSHYSLRSL